MIVFDITERDTYEGIDQWKNNFIDSVMNQDTVDSDISVPIIVVGNKLDLGNTGKRQIEQREVFADWIDTGLAIEYIETSA